MPALGGITTFRREFTRVTNIVFTCLVWLMAFWALAFVVAGVINL